MKALLKLLLAMLALLLLPPPAESAVSWVFLPGRGFEITFSETSPVTLAGTEIELQATAQYYFIDDEGEEAFGELVSDPLTLVVGEATVKREWVYTIPPGISAVVDHDGGNGGVELLGNNGIRAWINIANTTADVQTFRWRLILTP